MAMNVDCTQLHRGVLEPPISKSDAHRALAFAWMLDQPRPELRAPVPDDVRRMAEGLQRFGGVIDCGDGAAPFHILVALASVQPGLQTRFTGSARLGERPHEPLFAALRELGAGIDGQWRVQGAAPRQARVAIDTRVSSQYASALVIAACALRQRFELDLIGPTVSRGYLELTLRWARHAGFEIEDLEDRIVIAPGTPKKLPAIPSDWSSIGYLLLMARASGSEVKLDDAGEHPDRMVLRHLGFDAPLEMTVSQAPDLAPTLAAAAMAGVGTSTFSDAQVLRHKESDRLAGVLELAAAVGAPARVDGDRLEITAAPARPHLFRFDCRDDHRLTMTAVCLACLFHCRAELTRTDGIAKSFPDFLTQAKRCGVVVY
jgi:3-phosphoshikimate 1-carboxyvinyltransferase